MIDRNNKMQEYTKVLTLGLWLSWIMPAQAEPAQQDIAPQTAQPTVIADTPKAKSPWFIFMLFAILAGAIYQRWYRKNPGK